MTLVDINFVWHDEEELDYITLIVIYKGMHSHCSQHGTASTDYIHC